MIDTPKQLAERARQMAARREREADNPERRLPPDQIKIAADNYRTLAEALETQTAHRRMLREQIAAAEATRDLVHTPTGEPDDSAPAQVG
jgi:hypothetical protein